MRKEIKLSELENLLDANDLSESHSDDEDSSDNIVLIDKEGCYGFKTYRYGYELHFRRKYESDTLIETTNGKTGMTKRVVIKAGEYGPWQLTEGPFHNTLQSLLIKAKRLIVKNTISEQKDLSTLVEIINQSELRIAGILNGY